jgi:hypothetical protein
VKWFLPHTGQQFIKDMLAVQALQEGPQKPELALLFFQNIGARTQACTTSQCNQTSVRKSDLQLQQTLRDLFFQLTCQSYFFAKIIFKVYYHPFTINERVNQRPHFIECKYLDSQSLLFL